MSNWKKKNKDVPSTFNTLATTPVSLLPSPTNTTTSTHEQESERWNKGKHNYTKYLQLKDDADFTDWKDRFATYGTSKYIS